MFISWTMHSNHTLVLSNGKYCHFLAPGWDFLCPSQPYYIVVIMEKRYSRKFVVFVYITFKLLVKAHFQYNFVFYFVVYTFFDQWAKCIESKIEIRWTSRSRQRYFIKFGSTQYWNNEISASQSTTNLFLQRAIIGFCLSSRI